MKWYLNVKDSVEVEPYPREQDESVFISKEVKRLQ